MQRLDKRDGSSTRQNILTVALEHFTDHGYEGTPLRAISDELGMTKAALYYHFDSKEALLLELITPALQDVDVVLAEAEEAAPAPGWEERLIANYADVLIRHLARIRLLARDINVLRQPTIEETVNDHMARLQELLVADSAELEDRTRVFAALTVVQRVLIGNRGEPIDPDDPGATSLRSLVICMAMELLEHRCDEPHRTDRTIT